MFCYALGWTQHTSGVQMIRAAAILQLLLGNMGRPGGGIMAMRGHASIQGSTDIPTLFDLLPGYLPMPKGREERARPRRLRRRRTAPSAAGGRTSTSTSSRCSRPTSATPRRRRTTSASPRLPKITGNHSHFPTMLRALDGGARRAVRDGPEPGRRLGHSGLQRRALGHLKWLVVRDLTELETATFWRDGPEVRSGELRTEDIQTEVFLMPAASHIEKDGHFTNTQRLLQWHDKALEPPGDARSELWFMHHLFKRVREHYRDSEADRDWPIRNLTWDYPEHGEIREPDAEAVLREINGYDMESGEPVSGFAELKADGSTACGCWIYAGCYADGVNQTRRREPGDLDAPGGWVSPEWAWAWPANRRMLYNRASADPEGNAVVGAQALRLVGRGRGEVDGLRRAGLPARQGARTTSPSPDAMGMDAIAGTDPFIMMADGKGWLFSPAGLLDGPMPTHYEPFESPVPNLLYPGGRLQPGDADLEPVGQPDAPDRRPALPVRGHDVPAHRAPHRRRDEPQPAVAGGAAAGDVRRDRPGARRGARDRGRRLDGDRDRARGDRGARPRHRADAAAAHRGPARPPDRAAVALGLRDALARRQRQRPRRARRRPERLDPGGQGVHLRRPRRPPHGRDDREAQRRARSGAMPSLRSDAPSEDTATS